MKATVCLLIFCFLTNLCLLSYAEEKVNCHLNDEEVEDLMMKNVDRERLKNLMRELSKEPKLAGTRRDYEVADYIEKYFEEIHMDSIDISEYEVLISYPDPEKPNKVQILNESGEVEFTARNIEEVMRPEDYSPDLIPAYLGNSPPGTVSGGLVFMNYGRDEDLRELVEVKGIQVEGNICIGKYGKIYRGNKVENAARYGAIGVILYFDPEDYASEGTDSEHVYPEKWWNPESAIQRGSAYTQSGDPLTPGWPAIEGAYRLNISEAKLPLIPAQPISYGDAKRFLELIEGEEAPESWKGGFHDIEYRLGPQLRDGKSIHLDIHNNYKSIVGRNVIGKIEGAIEPDRYVFSGNHRDSWGFGSIDATTGMVSMLEAARIFAQMKEKGCRPRRSLLFASWDVEEHGLMGSFEYVEDHFHELDKRAVAMINVDTCVAGPIFKPMASPFLWTLIRDTMKKVPDVADTNITLYDSWLATHPIAEDGQLPELRILSSSSDHVAFDSYTGIPSAMLKFYPNDSKSGNYPAYHTAYDNIYYLETFVDPEYRHMESCSRLLIGLLTALADQEVVPLDPIETGRKMEKVIEKMKEDKVEEKLQLYGVNLDLLSESVSNFTTAAERWSKHSECLLVEGSDNLFAFRILSDQIMSIQRSFIMPEGVLGRRRDRNAIFSPSKFDNYATAAFPGIEDALVDIADGLEEDSEKNIKVLQKHLSDLYIIVRQATKLLTPVLPEKACDLETDQKDEITTAIPTKKEKQESGEVKKNEIDSSEEDGKTEKKADKKAAKKVSKKKEESSEESSEEK